MRRLGVDDAPGGGGRLTGAMKSGLGRGRQAPATPAEALRQALLAPAIERAVEVAGAAIRFRVWEGPRERPPVLLVHGMLAHARWWDAVAGWLAKDRPVAALDLSGMGDSGARLRYSRSVHGLEIGAVAEAAGFAAADLVAHSYGGDPAIRACLAAPGQFRRLALLDCRLPLPGVAPAPPRTFKAVVFPTFEAAKARFRLWPDSPLADPLVMDHVVSHSIRRVPEGWSWKFDAALETHPDPRDPLDLRGLTTPTVFVRGEESTVTSPQQMAITRAHLTQAAYLAIPAAGHHLMLEQPVALATLLRSLLA